MLPWLACLALATGLAAPREPPTIAFGSAAGPCQWPTVVSFRTSEKKCTATLVHPQVVVTAAHCLETAAPGALRLGEGFQPAAAILDIERCGVDPEYLRTHAPSTDVGWCVLAEPFEGIPPTPLLTDCEVAWLHEGLPAVIVGFGQDQHDAEFGTKRYAFTALDSDLRADGTVWVGDAEVNGCLGDSGGPTFVQSPAGTWHTVGVLTFGPECGQGPVLYRALHDRIAWLETETGFDLSPCHDADGGSSPGPACDPLALDPLAASSWDELCAGPLAEAPACPAPESETESQPETSQTDEGSVPAGDDATGCACQATPARPAPVAPWWLLLALAPATRRRAWPSSRRSAWW